MTTYHPEVSGPLLSRTNRSCVVIIAGNPQIASQQDLCISNTRNRKLLKLAHYFYLIIVYIVNNKQEVIIVYIVYNKQEVMMYILILTLCTTTRRYNKVQLI